MSVFIIEAFIYVEHNVNIDLGVRGCDYVWKYVILHLENEDLISRARTFLDYTYHDSNRTTECPDTVAQQNVDL